MRRRASVRNRDALPPGDGEQLISGKQGASRLASALVHYKRQIFTFFISPEAAGSGGFTIHAIEKA
jgi:hypothetical protein